MSAVRWVAHSDRHVPHQDMQTVTKHQKRRAAGDSEGEIRAARLPKGGVYGEPQPFTGFTLGLSYWASHVAALPSNSLQS